MVDGSGWLWGTVVVEEVVVIEVIVDGRVSGCQGGSVRRGGREYEWCQ